MTARRHWRQWPSRLGKELNGASGVAGFGGTVAGLGGTALSTAGTFAAATPIGIGVAIVGGVVALGAFGHAFWKSIPEKLASVETQVGKELPLTALDNIHPPVPKLSVVGRSNAGKTTLKRGIPNLPADPGRTQNVSAFIIPLTMNPIQYIAILDSDGKSDPQQYLIAEPADIICVVLDHNESDSENVVDSIRLGNQAELLVQLRNHFEVHRTAPVPRMHFLLNKRDLWQTADQESQTKLQEFFAAEVAKWKNGKWASKVSSAEHSNNLPADIAAFVRVLSDFIAEYASQKR